MTPPAQAPRATLCRGTLVTVASPGAYSGKPRPAVVVQADRWLQAHPSVTLCPLTSTLMEAPLVRIAAAFHRTPPPDPRRNPRPGGGVVSKDQLVI